MKRMISLWSSREKGGVVYPLVMLAVIMTAGFVITSSTLNQGLKTQLIQTDHHHFSFILAYSAMSKTLAKIHTKAWSQRPFKDKPHTEYNVSFNNGTYDLWVENTPPNKQYQADIYVRTTLANRSSLYFWRIRFQDDLLDVSNKILIDFFLTGEAKDFPQSAAASAAFAKKIDDLMAKRKANQKNSDITATSILGENDPSKIVGVLGGRPMNKFAATYPPAADDPSVLLGKKRQNPIPFPGLQPPSSKEVPDKPGPGGTGIGPTGGGNGLPGVWGTLPTGEPPLTGGTPGGATGGSPPPGDDGAMAGLGGTPPPGESTPTPPSTSPPADNSFPPPSGDPGVSNEMTDLAKTISENAQKNVDSFETAEGFNNPTDQAKAIDQRLAAGKAIGEALDGMPKLITAAQQVVQDAPGSDAAQAAKDLAVSTSVSALQKIGDGISNYVTGQYAPNAHNQATDPNSTSADLAATVADKQNTLDAIKGGVEKMKSIADSLGPLASDPKVQAAISQTLADAQKTIDEATKALEEVKKALEEKKKEEAAKAAADAAAAAAAGDGTGTGQ